MLAGENKYIPPFYGDLEGFPESDELPEGVKCIKLQDTYGYRVDFRPDIEFCKRDSETLHIQLLLPQEGGSNQNQNKFPLIVFVQGSAWHRQEIYAHLQNMMRVCERGFAVAIVQYRPSDAAPFPAQIQDVKTAIRFLRKNADEYRIQSDRIALWGDSSGAHTALIAGFTQNESPDNELYGEYSAEVRCIIDWYGPTDFTKMNCYPSTQNHIQPDSPEGMVIGRKNVLDNPELTQQANPMNYLFVDKPTPPVLIMHGGRDELVPFNQGCRLYSHMTQLGKVVEMYKLSGAYHGFGGFNSDEALNIVIEFVNRYI